MKSYRLLLVVLFLYMVSPRSVSAQQVVFNHTFSAASLGNTALTAFRETPMLGFQHNDNNGVWTNKLLSVSVPFEDFGFQAAYLRDEFSVLNLDLLSLGVNKRFELKGVQLAVAVNLEGWRKGFNDDHSVIFPDLVRTTHRLAYSFSAAARYKGFTLFGGTRQRTLVQSEFADKSPIVNMGMGYHFQKGNWRLQGLLLHERYTSTALSNGLLGIRYRFIEVGFGGKSFKELNGIAPAFQGAWVNKRFKLSYMYLDRGGIQSSILTYFTLQEHEVSLLVSLHKKGKRASFEIF